MVASVSAEPYNPFEHPSMVEEGLQSSEESSGLHSPVFGQRFPGSGDNCKLLLSHHIIISNFSSASANKVRYLPDQVDVLHVSRNLSHFDYPPTLIAQQPPLIESPLVIPSPSHSVAASFHSGFPIHSRNQPPIDFPVQSSVNSVPPRLSAFEDPSAGGPTVAFQYRSSSPRPLPSASQSYDHPHLSRPIGTLSGGMPAQNVQPEPSVTHESHRKEISTVVIACRQCRSRKIRCDSMRPVCNNCVRRSNECQYDAVPKRRGPDKRPGTRQRSCKKRPPPVDGSVLPSSGKRKRTVPLTSTPDATPQSKVKENMTETNKRQKLDSIDLGQNVHVPNQSGHHTTPSPIDLRTSPSDQDISGYGKSLFPRQIDLNVLSHTSDPVRGHMQHSKFPLPSEIVQSDNKTWWDSFLNSYSLHSVMEDLNYLFSDTSHYLSFLHLPSFLSSLADPAERLLVQPAFVAAGSALASLMKSSEAEESQKGRNKALWLKEMAARAFDNSCAHGWIDARLAEAALILALFEISAHPQHDPDRSRKSLTLLDTVLHRIALTSLDSRDPEVSLFSQGSVPTVTVPVHDTRTQCTCITPDPRQPIDPFASMSCRLPWNEDWTPLQMKDEECRRLSWCALGLVASYTAQCAAFDKEVPAMSLSEPSSYALLFPGEVHDRNLYRNAQSLSCKESVWALYCRSMLLWVFSYKLSSDPLFSEERKSECATEAWQESQAVQDALEMHACNLDTALLYMSKEYIFNSRAAITKVFRSLQGLDDNSPSFKRKQADNWVHHQMQVFKRVKMSIHHLTESQGHLMTRRPYQVTWFLDQLAMCLMFWNKDNTLVSALELGKYIVIPCDAMNALWPSPLHQHHYTELRSHLTDACTITGIEPPLHPNYNLPATFRRSQ